jgi:hypothetical protein
MASFLHLFSQMCMVLGILLNGLRKLFMQLLLCCTNITDLTKQ